MKFQKILKNIPEFHKGYKGDIQQCVSFVHPLSKIQFPIIQAINKPQIIM